MRNRQSQTGLLMQQVAVETSFACCGCDGELPFCPRWRHTFPGGISHTISAPPPPPQPLATPPTPTPFQWTFWTGFFQQRQSAHTPAERVRGHHPNKDILSQSGSNSAKKQMFLIFGKMAPIQNEKGSDISEWADSLFYCAAADVKLAASGYLVT